MISGFPEENVELRDFEPGDIPGAGAIASQIWGNEIPGLSAPFRRKLYEYLVRYYHVRGSSLSCTAHCRGEMCAFLLASEGEHSPGADDSFFLQLSDSEKVFLESYRAYLEGNRQKEMLQLREKEALLLLFASVRKGCGSMLMERFFERCRERGIPSVLLWTDDTCDFEWYRRNCFCEVAHFAAEPSLPGRKLETFIFRREIR